MGRASEKRVARVRSLLLRTLSDIVRDELDDPRLQMVTFTDARMARDLSSAEIMVVSAVGGAEAAQQCVNALESAKYVLWNRLRDETDLRIVPQLRFVVDPGPQYQDEIEQILRTIPPPAVDAETSDADVDLPKQQPEVED
jgi:ribosome-binding factor A